MKKAFFILAFAAAALAVSCNKEEAKVNQTKYFEGDNAYMTVTFHDVGDGSATRATDAGHNNDGYVNGSSLEYAVEDAYFYFYDEDGIYVTEAKAWNSGTVNETDENIEFDGYTQVVLSGLTHTSYPNWVVTVLNKPTNFSAPETLEEFAALLSDDNAVGIMMDENTDFVMSTSSYVSTSNTYASANNGHDYYFATPVTEDNFTLEPVEYGDNNEPTNCTAVEIYVERLAAKVTVSVEASLAATAQTGTNAYPLTQSVDGTDTQLYISFDAWALNATARHSNIVKDIDDTWTNTGTDDLGTGWTWNDADYHRSYWGKCYFYGLGYGTENYPTKGSQGNTDSDETGADALSDYLVYTSLGENGTTYELGTSNYAYCAENTNIADIAAIPSALTSVLIKATVYDASGNAVSLVRHDGKLYEPDSYLDYVLEHLPEVYTRTGNDTDGYTYTKIDNSYLYYDYLVDGYVQVLFGTEEDGYEAYSDVTFYTIDGDDVNGYTVVKEYSASDLEALIEEYNTNIGYDANYYNGGEMYYSIPIQHFNNDYSEKDENGKTLVLEANYGVVRNHWYSLTVNSLESLGKGIYDPDEVIVPTPDEDTYYVGASIHILSWKLVNQGVSL